MKSLTVNIQITESDTVHDIAGLLLCVIANMNRENHGIMNAFVDGVEVFDCNKGFSEEFFSQKE